MAERTKKLRLPDYDVDGVEAFVEIRDPLYVSKKTKGFWDIVRKWQQSVRDEEVVEADEAGDELVHWFITDFVVPGVEKKDELPSVVINALWTTEVLSVLNPSNLTIEKV